MSQRSRTLRALVTERLSAAAEEIFELVERTIAEYEEELCRSKAENLQLLEENLRGQQLLEENLRGQQLLEENLRGQQLHRTGDSQKPFLQSPFVPELLQSNEERPEQGAALLLSVKSEEQPSPIQPGQTDDDEWGPPAADWGPPAGVSTAQTQTAADGDRCSPVRIKDPGPAAHSSALFTNYTPESGKHECSFCSKRFITKQRLQVHTRVHTGERPFSCTVCHEAFAAKGHLKDHTRVHTGEKPYSCSICDRTFARQFTLQGHMRTHTGERPYSCSECDATFAQRPHLTKHMLKHTYGHGNG